MGEKQSFVIGLTGGIGSGKTRVAELLEELGAAVECSDRIVRELQVPGGAALAAIAKELGPEYVLPSGELDRARLGERVFREPEARRRLNDLIHPLVFGELRARLEAHIRAGASLIVLDIPLLLEGRASGRGSGTKLPFDAIVVVYADSETQIRRVMQRDGLSREDAVARLEAQLPIEEKRRLADVVIDNSSDWAQTEAQVRALHERWSNRGRSGSRC